MKSFIVLSVVFAYAVARPSGVLIPTSYSYSTVSHPFVAPAVSAGYYAPGIIPSTHAVITAKVAGAPLIATAPVSSQYHTQDVLGQYSFGYASPLSSKSEAKTIDGVTRGGYNYIDAEGKLQTVSYVSDAYNGFRVAATNIPVPNGVVPVQVPDTPEVVAARTAHLAAHEEAKAASAAADANAPQTEAPVSEESENKEKPAEEPEIAAKAEPAVAVEKDDSEATVVGAPLLPQAVVPGYSAAVPSFYSYNTFTHHHQPQYFSASQPFALPYYGVSPYSAIAHQNVISSAPVVSYNTFPVVEAKRAHTVAAVKSAVVQAGAPAGVTYNGVGVPADTAEVAAAKAAHLAAFEEIKQKNSW